MKIKARERNNSIAHESRINAFYEYCDEIENRSITKMLRKGPFSPKFTFNENSIEINEFNFDEEHLLSLAALLRQFIEPSETFFYRSMETAARDLFGYKKEIEEFCSSFDSSLNKKEKISNFQKQSKEGLLSTGKYSALDLIKAVLYTGPLHSDGKIIPKNDLEKCMNLIPMVKLSSKLEVVRICAGLILGIIEFKRLLKAQDLK